MQFWVNLRVIVIWQRKNRRQEMAYNLMALFVFWFSWLLYGKLYPPPRIITRGYSYLDTDRESFNHFATKILYYSGKGLFAFLGGFFFNNAW